MQRVSTGMILNPIIKLITISIGFRWIGARLKLKGGGKPVTVDVILRRNQR